MALTWVACWAQSGIVIADLPGVEPTTVSTTMNGYTTAQAALPLPDAPLAWPQATKPFAAYWVLLDDEMPIWGGIVTRRVRSDGDKVTVALMDIPGYFLRRYVGDETFSDVDQCEIVETLVDTYVGDSLPIAVSASASATTRDRTYTDASDKTIFSVITELAGVINGPEWRIGWAEGTSGGQVTFTPVLYVADRLGSEPPSGLDPAVTFQAPGALSNSGAAVTSATVTEGYGAGEGANDTLATSTAISDTRPESAHFTYADPDRLVAEYRFTPSTSITNTDTLDGHAEAALARMQEGRTGAEVSTVYAGDPKIDVDLVLGDTVGLVLGGTFNDNGDPAMPAFPEAYVATARLMGWSLTVGPEPVLTPTLGEITEV